MMGGLELISVGYPSRYPWCEDKNPKHFVISQPETMKRRRGGPGGSYAWQPKTETNRSKQIG
jgi:hypothetical protein